MARQPTDTSIEKIGNVLHTDSDPLEQPKGTHKYALNAVNETHDGVLGKLNNELGHVNVGALNPGFLPIGDHYIEDDLQVVISTNPVSGKDQIGTLDKADVYTPIVDTKVLKLSINNQCDVRYRLKRGNERIIYWVDGLNNARSFNLDRPQNYYTTEYKLFLKAGGDPNTYLDEKWDADSFNLIKTYKTIPFFADVKIVETGNILAGSYNFAIQYVDDDLNPTEWITTSNVVRIFNDTVNNPYERIRGSKNITSTAQTFGRANKSIKLTITNLDRGFPYYRVAIIRAAGLNGLPEKVLLSDVYSTTEHNFTYSGNDSQLTEGKLEEIVIGGAVIYAPKHIEQIENRLELAHTKGKGINWCEFQAFASKISSDLTTKTITLNSVLSEGNSKNAKSTFMFRGYMPGEVYSFGIVYIFKDGYLSPVFHIPGKSPSNTTSQMGVYTGETPYLDVHNCSTNDYWGKDSDGNALVNTPYRHHKFPLRVDVNKPLFTRTSNNTDLTRNRLNLNIDLAVGKTYPLDTGGNPIAIPFSINYQITSTGTTTQFSGILTQSELGVPQLVYDDISTLDDITAGVKGGLDPACVLSTSYMIAGSEIFTINFIYDNYTASTATNDDETEIFGIQFNNITLPHPDVIGFYIVRNERTDDDKLVVDNAILGPMTSFNQYKSFGLITPKQFFSANNCGVTGDSGKQLQFYNKGFWFFNPEFQFSNKKLEFDTLLMQGYYVENSTDYPTISNDPNSSCNSGGGGDQGGSKGLYINDVQAGTSYDPNLNTKKTKDDDGFDLLVGYKNVNFEFIPEPNRFPFPTKKQALYLNAASYQTIGSDTFYNTSVDNKIGQYISDEVMDPQLQELFNTATDNTSGLVYGTLLKNNTTAYSNFINRPYYKEHNNPYYFNDIGVASGVNIFNGDAEISAINMVSSVYYDIVTADRTKKSSIWKIVAGAVLIAGAVVAEVLSAGTLTPLAVSAISYGVSLISSGIKFDQMKSMIEDQYDKGLKETVVDGGLFSTIRDTIGRVDDTIRWFSDRANCIYIESSVPFGLRSGLTSGVSDFTDAPSTYNETAFRTYLTEKFTVLDTNQGQGRLYKGYASAEFYDINKDYMRFNKEKQFSHLSLDYDCCNDSNEVNPNRVWYSEQSFQEEKVDNYRIFLPNNYRDIEGEHGEITNIYRLGNNLFIECREVLWQLPKNNQERVTGEIVSFIGTGDFFSIPPQKVQDDDLGSGGTQHKWASIKTEFGVISINESQHKITLHGDGIKDITIGNRSWFRNNLKANLSKQLFDKAGIKFLHDNNPANPNGIGYHSTYDTRYKRALITKIDYSILQEKLDHLIIVQRRPTSLSTDFVYCLDDGLFYQGISQITFDNTAYFENRSWTISYSFTEQGFISYHSYIPNYYIHNPNNLYLFEGSEKYWKANQLGLVQTYFGKYAPFIFEYVAVNNPLADVPLEDITIQTRARRFDPLTKGFRDENLITFNKINCYNTKQSTGELIMRAKQAQANLQNWYQQQTTNLAGSILIDRRLRDWNINRLRDYVIDYDKSLFSSDWSLTKFFYPIDKVVNPDAINFNKPWQDLQVLKDKYVIIRLKFDNFNDVMLSFSYSLETEPIS